MEKIVIKTDKAPGALGPYSQAIKVNGMVYTSGQLGINPETGEMPEDLASQAHLVFKNLKAVLEAAGTSMDNVVKTLVFLSDMNDFVPVNDIYKEYFINDYPARSAVEVARLPKDAKLEIEVIAIEG
ncbi:MAG TPA: RidA family protein [Epulopiscium sp.]|nr:RidA family protein [Candidatus Epulonipiscium sp.]